MAAIPFRLPPDRLDAQRRGFDARAEVVWFGLGHYNTDVVVTVELSVRFLSLARLSKGLVFEAHVVRSVRRFAFAEGFLGDVDDRSAARVAMASAIVAPARP